MRPQRAVPITPLIAATKLSHLAISTKLRAAGSGHTRIWMMIKQRAHCTFFQYPAALGEASHVCGVTEKRSNLNNHNCPVSERSRRSDEVDQIAGPRISVRPVKLRYSVWPNWSWLPNGIRKTGLCMTCFCNPSHVEPRHIERTLRRPIQHLCVVNAPFLHSAVGITGSRR